VAASAGSLEAQYGAARVLAADDVEVSEQCAYALEACWYEIIAHEVAEVLQAIPGAIPRLLQHFVQSVSVSVVVGGKGGWIWEAGEKLHCRF